MITSMKNFISLYEFAGYVGINNANQDNYTQKLEAKGKKKK